MTKFDIAAKIVTDRQKAFVVHAGIGRRNYGTFIRDGAVFLEVPSINLTPDIAASKEKLRRAVRRFREKLAYQNDPAGRVRPSELLADYSDSVFAEARLSTLTGSIAALYNRVRVGDLIVTPGYDRSGEYRVPIIHFGEVTAPFDTKDVLDGVHGNALQVPYRRVKWLRSIERRKLSPAMEAKIGKPPAVREIEIGDSTVELLNFAYDNYIYGDDSASMLTAARYDGMDFLVQNNASALIAFFVAAYAYSRSGNKENIENIDEFTAKYFPLAEVDGIKMSFASPGYWQIFGGTATLGAFVALGVSILTTTTDLAEMRAPVEVTNSASVGQEEANDLRQSINMLLQSIEDQTLQKLQIDAKEAKKRIGLESSVKKVPN